MLSKQVLMCVYERNVLSAPGVGLISSRSRNGAPSRKGREANDKWANDLRQATNAYAQGAEVRLRGWFSARMQLNLHATRRNTPRRFALGARDVCLVGENPTCSVLTL